MLTQKADIIFSSHNVVNGIKIDTIFFRENNRKVLIFLDSLIDYMFSQVIGDLLMYAILELKQPELFIDKFRKLHTI